MRKSEHFHDADAAGQRLGHGFHQVQRLGTGNPHGSAIIALVDDHLDIRKKLGGLLYLVNQNRRTIALQEKRRIFLRRLQNRRVVKRYVNSVDTALGLFLHQMLEHSLLPTCLRSGHGDYFEVLGIASHQRFERSFDVHDNLISSQIWNTLPFLRNLTDEANLSSRNLEP